HGHAQLRGLQEPADRGRLVPRTQVHGRVFVTGRAWFQFAGRCVSGLALWGGLMLAAQAATLTVQPGGDLAEAVRQASRGDGVEVKRGKSRVNLLLDRPVRLRGLVRRALCGGNEGGTIRVTSPDVVIEGLIVRDSGDSVK